MALLLLNACMHEEEEQSAAAVGNEQSAGDSEGAQGSAGVAEDQAGVNIAQEVSSSTPNADICLPRVSHTSTRREPTAWTDMYV